MFRRSIFRKILSMETFIRSALESRAYAAVAISLIIFSVLVWTSEELLVLDNRELALGLDYLELAILILFSAEFSLRMLVAPSKRAYLTSQEGIIDLLAILPSLLLLISPVGANSVWLRLLQLSRFTRVLSLKQKGKKIGGLVGATMPLVATAVLLKLMLLTIEQTEWWDIDSSINILIGVSGFSIAILMGSKLSTVSARLYEIEDTVCRIVGAMRDMWWTDAAIRPALSSWSTALEKFLEDPLDQKIEIAGEMREMTDELEANLEKLGIGGPNTSGFHRDAAFLINKATTTTPVAYDDFLKYVSILYVLILIISIPGIVGMISVVLSSFVIGGIYLLVSDLDNPLDYSNESFINAKLDALIFWNDLHGRLEERIGKQS